MIVAVNGRAAVRDKPTGVERWATELATRLPALRPERYGVIAPSASLAGRLGHPWEQSVLPARARVSGARVVVSPANFAPLAGPRNVVVIHDVSALLHPGWYSSAYVALVRAIVPRVARRAARIITVSSFSREEIAVTLGVARERIDVVPGGVDHARFNLDADAAGARRALGLTRPYVLAVGSRNGRKNLASLDVAAARLDGEGVDVVVAGGGGAAQFAGHEDGADIRALGSVDDALLPGLYAGAAAFALPSRHEGFGLTCLEAMACGVPVVASARAALPETCGDAARFVDPDDSAGIADALQSVIGDATLREAGLARAALFSWSRTATEVDAVVSRVLDETR